MLKCGKIRLATALSSIAYMGLHSNKVLHDGHQLIGPFIFFLFFFLFISAVHVSNELQKYCIVSLMSAEKKALQGKVEMTIPSFVHFCVC